MLSASAPLIRLLATIRYRLLQKTCQRLLNAVFKLHGAPQELVSDRDTRFTSAFWTEVRQLMHTERNMGTAYHPQSDGQTERMNRVLEDRHYVSPNQTDWDKHLPMVGVCHQQCISRVCESNSNYAELWTASPYACQYRQRYGSASSRCF